jgi:NADH dehydrogenase
MHVLVAGSGLLARSTVDALLQKGHTARLLSESAERDARLWPRGVEARVALPTGRGLEGSARGCDAVLALFAHARRNPAAHARGAAKASRLLVAEAERAGAQRMVLLTSLEAGLPDSEEHRARSKAEAALRGARVHTLVVRASVVYGPEEGALALLLRMVRTLPAVPLPDNGRHLVQPIWHQDLGQALAAAVERTDLDGRTLEVAGPDRASLAEIVDELASLTGRSPRKIGVPALLAEGASMAAGLLGVRMPLTEAERALLSQEVVLPAGRVNALTSVFGVTPTLLREGLRRLAKDGVAQPPSEGMGPIVEHRYWVDLERPFQPFRGLRDLFRRQAHAVLETVGPRPAAAARLLKKGDTVFLRVPGRGEAGLRVVEIAPDRVTAVTAAGHPLAGVVTFGFLERGRDVRFEIKVQARAADPVDMALQALGGWLQDADWTAVARRMADLSKATWSSVETSARRLDAVETERLVGWADRLVERVEKETRPVAVRPPRRPAAAARGRSSPVRARTPPRSAPREPRRSTGK